MTEELQLADECRRLLDNGWVIKLFANELGSYTAMAYPGPEGEPEQLDDDRLTDDFTPSKALYRLTEKVFGNIV